MKALIFVFIILVILMAVSIAFALLIYCGYRITLKPSSECDCDKDPLECSKRCIWKEVHGAYP